MNYFKTILLFAAAFVIVTSFTAVRQLHVTSSAFTNNGMIPAKYSCEGEEINPPLDIIDIPPQARSLAIIVHDPDAPVKGGFTHWVVWNIPTDGKIPENFKGGDQGINGAKQAGYKGMCPPSGSHHYLFKVYALDTKFTIDKHTGKADLEKKMQGHIVASGEITGLFKKPR
jgi:Raf kinase inhibitor-like YbhB/YbcL family protein